MMFSCKNILSFGVLLVMVSNPSFAGVYKKNLIFVNCTSSDVQMDTIARPYKFSLSPTSEAQNGYSEAYSITIPAQSVLKYQHMSVFFNGYIDGSINFNFSGGVSGHAIIQQKQDSLLVSGIGYCPSGGSAVATSYVSIDKIIGTSDNPTDIEFLNAEQMVSLGYNYGNYMTNDAMIINLGCYSRS